MSEVKQNDLPAAWGNPWQSLRQIWTSFWAFILASILAPIMAPKRSAALELTRNWPKLLMAGLAVPCALLLSADSGDFLHFRDGSGATGDARASVRVDIDGLTQSGNVPLALPAAYLDILPETAREINAAIAFSSAPNPASAAFSLGGDEASKARARDCLAAAQFYEAGTDWEGQRAVAQVVLNRVRHPAFPGSVCGVVFQGSERNTGCQFSFTCDGAMRRRPASENWQQSRVIAGEAIGGDVYSKVGHATHYHTNWVVPYWSGELVKITNVRTHLFFRWKGAWGRPGAFSASTSGLEPVIGMMGSLSPFHTGADVLESEGLGEDFLEEGMSEEGEAILAINDRGGQNLSAPARNLPSLAGVNLRGGQLRMAHPAGDAFGFLLPSQFPGSFGLLAYDVCKGRSFCKVMGWTTGADVPLGFPVSYEAQQKMAFMYLYDRANRREIMAWNCEEFPRSDASECLSDQLTVWDGGA